MNELNAFLPFGLTSDNLLLVLMTAVAFMTVLAVWYGLIERDPMERRARVLADRRAELRGRMLKDRGPNRRQQESLSTYDQNWLDNVFPFLPADFDDRYYQAAPEDQQIEYPQGGEEVQLLNLTPDGRTRFRLPTVEVPVVFFRKLEKPEPKQAVLDTIVIEPDLNRMLLTWRASVPLKRNVFEMVQVLVGNMSRAWWRARELGKTYYPSIGEMVRSRSAEELV